MHCGLVKADDELQDSLHSDFSSALSMFLLSIVNIKTFVLCLPANDGSNSVSEPLLSKTSRLSQLKFTVSLHLAALEKIASVMNTNSYTSLHQLIQEYSDLPSLLDAYNA